jgi:hypothetical protein
VEKELLEKLQQSSVQLLEFVEQAGTETTNFAKEQVPLVIHEVLNWGFYSNLAYGTIQLLTAAILFYLSKRLWDWARTEDPKCESPIILVSLFPLLPTIILFCCSITHYLTVIKIAVAPRLYLIEQLQTLIGKK